MRLSSQARMVFGAYGALVVLAGVLVYLFSEAH